MIAILLAGLLSSGSGSAPADRGAGADPAYATSGAPRARPVPGEDPDAAMLRDLELLEKLELLENAELFGAEPVGTR